MTVSNVGSTQQVPDFTGTRRISGTAPLDSGSDGNKLDPAKFMASHKSVMHKVKSPVTANTLFAALQDLKANKNHESTKFQVKVDAGDGHDVAVQGKIKETGNGLMIKGTVSGLPGLPKMQFKVAIKGEAAHGGLHVDARAHGGGQHGHVSGHLKVS